MQPPDRPLTMRRPITMAILAMLMGLATLVLLTACGGPSEAEKRYNAGNELVENGRLEEALAEYDEAVRLDPKLTSAYYNRGLVYLLLRRYQQAIEDLDQVLLLNPRHASAYANRALAYTALGDDEKARPDIAGAMELGIERATLEEMIEEMKQQR